MAANISRNTGSRRKAGKKGCRNGAFIQKTLALPALCIALAGIANVIHGAKQYSRAEGKEAASFANSAEERIDGAALFASILLIFSRLSASVFAKSNRIVTFS